MTDNEIIKALNYCCGNIKNNDEECQEDMCYQVCLPESREEGIRWCREWLIKDALDLINRQKAEIERLNEKITAKDESNYYFMGQLRLAREKLLTAKSEAIKEFAERLKHFIIPQKADGYTREIVLKRDIDSLVKEMTEVETNQRKEDEKNG